MRSKAHSSGTSPHVRRRTDTDANDCSDRAFFLWLLASLVIGTMISGGIAMWAAMTNAPGFG
jgi:hypothetical protein